MILEYPTGAIYNDKVAERANRFILTRDVQNGKLTGLENVVAKINDVFEKEETLPHAIIVSGFHLLAKESRVERLAAAVDCFKNLPREIPIHLELASISDLSYLKTLSNTIFPYVDSIGLNEQELGSLYSVLSNGTTNGLPADELMKTVPSVTAVATALELVLATFSPQSERIAAVEEARGVSRIHFHSLSYHMIAKVPRVPVLVQEKSRKPYFKIVTSRWTNSEAAVARGSVMATLTACSTTVDAMVPEDGEVLAPTYLTVQATSGSYAITVDDVNPVGKWQKIVSNKLTVRYFYAPVVVCKAPLKTVGLGDAISASALAHSLMEATETW